MNNKYFLSSTNELVCFENNLIVSELGKLFNSKLSKLLYYNVVASELIVNEDWVTIIIKERGQEGGHFGLVLRCMENDISSIKNCTCQTVWNTLCESFTEKGYVLPVVYDPINHKPKKLNVTIYDFEKRSRIGFFMQYSKELQGYLQSKYPHVKIHIRFKDDDDYYYYMIFETLADQSLAEKLYGIKNIIKSVHEFCTRDDSFHVFDTFVPMPDITNWAELEIQGKNMSIIRDNPCFLSGRD